MPVTAKLSKAFHDKFGDEPTNELVNWLNAVDETYRADLRELNEVNFARFDAKLEQRLAQSDAKVEQRLAELRTAVTREIAEVRTDLIKWMFAFWAPTALAVIGTGIGVVTLLLRR